jgi:hypothetical protein
VKSKLPDSSVVTVKSLCQTGKIEPYLRQISTVARRISAFCPFPSVNVNVAFTRSASATPGATAAATDTIPIRTKSRANRGSALTEGHSPKRPSLAALETASTDRAN